MGIKLLSNKKFKIFIWIFGGIASLITILEFLIKIKILKPLLNLPVVIFKLLISIKIPDIVLLILILALIVWMYLIDKKLKKSLVVKEEKTNIIPKEDRPEKDEEKSIYQEHRWILFIIANTRRPVATEYLYKEFKKEFPLKIEVDFKSTINDLLELELISPSGGYGSNLLYSATSAGVELMKKVLDTGREKKS